MELEVYRERDVKREHLPPQNQILELHRATSADPTNDFSKSQEMAFLGAFTYNEFDAIGTCVRQLHTATYMIYGGWPIKVTAANAATLAMNDIEDGNPFLKSTVSPAQKTLCRCRERSPSTPTSGRIFRQAFFALK